MFQTISHYRWVLIFCLIFMGEANALGVCDDIMHARHPTTEAVRLGVRERIIPALYSHIEEASNQFAIPVQLTDRERFSFSFFLQLKESDEVVQAMNEIASATTKNEPGTIDLTDITTNELIFDEVLQVFKYRTAQLGLNKKITFHHIHGSMFGFEVRLYATLTDLTALTENLISNPIQVEYALKFGIESIYFNKIQFKVDRESGIENGWQGERKQFCKMFQLYTQGLSFKQIADAMNLINDEMFNAGVWTESVIAKIINRHLQFQSDLTKKGYSVTSGCDE